MATPEELLQNLESQICANGPFPLRLMSLFVLLLRVHFSDSSNIIQDSLSDCLWFSGENTRIIIELQGNYRPRTEDNKPAVIISRDKIAITNVGLDDSLTDNNPAEYLHTYSTAILVTCSARSLGQLDCLLAEVSQVLLAHVPYLRRTLGLAKLVVAGFSEPIQKRKDTPFWYSSTLSVPMIWVASVSLDKAESNLQAIASSLSVEF